VGISGGLPKKVHGHLNYINGLISMSVIIGFLIFAVIGLSLATFCLYLGFKNFKELINGLVEEKINNDKQ